MRSKLSALEESVDQGLCKAYLEAQAKDKAEAEAEMEAAAAVEAASKWEDDPLDDEAKSDRDTRRLSKVRKSRAGVSRSATLVATKRLASSQSSSSC